MVDFFFLRARIFFFFLRAQSTMPLKFVFRRWRVFFFFLTGAIDHAPQICLRAFWGAGAIAPVS
jgi:hypothetical protein